MKEISKSEAIKNNPYYDIIDLERPKSLRPKQSMEKRAGQFAPFAALTGYKEDVLECERLTHDRINLDEEEKNILDQQLNIIRNNYETLLVKIIFFVKDSKKTGGEYREKQGKVKKIDEYRGSLIFTDNDRILIKDIVKIDIKQYPKAL